MLHRERTKRGRAYPAPQGEFVRTPIADPYRTPLPAALGPIPPFRALREPMRGTRVEFWETTLCPRHPPDFDNRFYQTAHPLLILPGPAGDEEIGLFRLAAGADPSRRRTVTAFISTCAEIRARRP